MQGVEWHSDALHVTLKYTGNVVAMPASTSPHVTTIHVRHHSQLSRSIQVQPQYMAKQSPPSTLDQFSQVSYIASFV